MHQSKIRGKKTPNKIFRAYVTRISNFSPLMELQANAAFFDDIFDQVVELWRTNLPFDFPDFQTQNSDSKVYGNITSLQLVNFTDPVHSFSFVNSSDFSPWIMLNVKLSFCYTCRAKYFKILLQASVAEIDFTSKLFVRILNNTQEFNASLTLHNASIVTNVHLAPDRFGFGSLNLYMVTLQ